MSQPPHHKNPRRLRIGVVGCGWFARAAHLPALARLEREDRVEVAALCSRSAASLAAGQAMLRGKARACTDLHELLADPTIDLVDLLLPIAEMPGAIRSCLRAGKHVISEKPCAPTVAEGLRLMACQAELAAPPVWAVAENWRLKPTVRAIADVVRSGELGVLRFADFRHLTSYPPVNSAGWRARPDYPGGHLLDSGVHFAALLRETVGEIVQVSASVRQLRADLPPSDTVTSLLSFANQVEGSFRLSFAAGEPDGKRQPGLALVGTQGTLRASFDPGVVEISTRSRTRTLHFPADPWIEGGVEDLLSHVLDALEGRCPLKCTPAEALGDLAVMEAMLRSGHLGQPVGPRTLRPLLEGCTGEVSLYQGFGTFRPRHRPDCATVPEVRSAVVEAAAKQLRVRVFGRGNSWAPYLSTPDVCLQLGGGSGESFEINSRQGTVRAAAGMRLGDLTRALAFQGLVLPSLSFFPEVSVGGAVATATHGTSLRHGTLSDFVRSMDIVLASGELKTFGPDSPPDELRAARVSVGMLGVIVAVEFQAVPMPWVRFSELRMDLASFLAQRSALFGRYEHLWVHWTLGRNQVRIECLESSPESRAGFRPYFAGDEASWAPRPETSEAPSRFRRARGALRRARRLLGKNREAAPLTAPVTGPDVWMSMQYGVPLADIEAAIERILASDFPARHPGRVIELKFLKGEPGSLLGPNSDGDAVLFNLWWQIEASQAATVFGPFETVMRGMNGRPHWGKQHRAADPEYMRRAYRRWPEFEAVRSRLDPAGMFSIFQPMPRPSP